MSTPTPPPVKKRANSLGPQDFLASKRKFIEQGIITPAQRQRIEAAHRGLESLKNQNTLISIPELTVGEEREAKRAQRSLSAPPALGEEENLIESLFTPKISIAFVENYDRNIGSTNIFGKPQPPQHMHGEKSILQDAFISTSSNLRNFIDLTDDTDDDDQISPAGNLAQNPYRIPHWTLSGTKISKNILPPTSPSILPETSVVFGSASATLEEQHPISNINSEARELAQATPTYSLGPVLNHLHGKETLTVHIGTPPKSFIIHTQLLTSKSPYFSHLLRTNKFSSFTFPLISALHFSSLITWLYRGTLDNESVYPTPPTTHTEFLSQKHEVYLLASHFDILELKDYIVTSIGRFFWREQSGPTLDYVALLFPSPPALKLSGLQRYIVHCYLVSFLLLNSSEERFLKPMGIDDGSLSRFVKNYPELLVGILRKIRGTWFEEGGRLRIPWDEEICRFHDHGVEVECPQKGKRFCD